MKVCGQLNAPAAFPPEEELVVSRNRKLSCSRADLDATPTAKDYAYFGHQISVSRLARHYTELRRPLLVLAITLI
jgi:hypothetical protein